MSIDETLWGSGHYGRTASHYGDQQGKNIQIIKGLENTILPKIAKSLCCISNHLQFMHWTENDLHTLLSTVLKGYFYNIAETAIVRELLQEVNVERNYEKGVNVPPAGKGPKGISHPSASKRSMVRLFDSEEQNTK